MFLQNRNCSKEICYDTFLVPGMCILKEVCYLRTSITAIHFFYGSAIISWGHLKRSISQRQCVCFTTLWLIWENLKIIFIWGNPLSPCSFKGVYLFNRTSCRTSAFVDICSYKDELSEQLFCPKSCSLWVLISLNFLIATVFESSKFCKDNILFSKRHL